MGGGLKGIAGMTTFTLTNGGTVLHHIQFIRLDSGKTMADLDAGRMQGRGILVPG